MKKMIFALTALLTLVIALGVAGYAYAQTPNPDPRPGMMGPNGGMMGGGRMGGGRMGGFGGYGLMHNYMVNAVAEKLGLTPEAIQTRITGGETLWEIAGAEGLSDDEIVALMQESHTLAVEQAVAAGVITQAQADWMNSHMQQMPGLGGPGGCHGGGGGRSALRGPNL